MAAVRITPPGSAEVSAEEVMAALSLILASDAFAHVKRPSLFLRHVVESTLRGEQTLLKETLLGIEVFGREPSWNTRIDPIVRQEAARLRKRLARYYEAESPEVRIELPVGDVRPSLSSGYQPNRGSGDHSYRAAGRSHGGRAAKA